MQPFETLSYRGQIQRLRRLALSALEAYGVPGQRLVPLRHQTNTTFRVTAADRQQYVIRIHRPDGHSVDAIRSEMLWLLALRQDTDLAVPEPVLTRDGAPFVVADAPGMPEPRVCVLFRWLDGTFLDERLAPHHLERIGAVTARLHDHTAHWKLPPGFTRGRVDALTAQARGAAWIPPAPLGSATSVQPSDEDVDHTVQLVASECSAEDAAIVAHTIEQIRAVLDELGEGPDVFGMIHADLHQENYCFHRGTPHVIDFDDCGWGHYLFDLNVTLRELAHLPAYPALRDALLRGYRALRPLPAAYEAYLPTFFALRRIQLLMWVLESRTHPAFRDRWAEWARYDLDQLKQFVRGA